MLRSSRLVRAAAVTFFAVAPSACSSEGGGGSVTPVTEITCNLDRSLLITSLAPDAIPAINNPTMVLPGDPEASYLRPEDRVLGIVINGEARAYPHNILWHHEIINDEVAGERVSVTFCPLTGSGLAFRPEIDGRQLDLGVSGLLFANNLVLYDRTEDEVYGPQLMVGGVCESFVGRSLELLPLQEMSWERWQELHPDTRVVTGDTGYDRNYQFYPYRDWDDIDNPELYVPLPLDDSRTPKERILAIRDGDGGRAYPFLELAEIGLYAAINKVVSGIPTAVFYDGRSGAAALAFDARVGGQALTFAVGPEGFWTDAETGSIWSFDGSAVEGPLEGERLTTRSDAYTLFWFAWTHFQPNGEVFEAL